MEEKWWDITEKIPEKIKILYGKGSKTHQTDETAIKIHLTDETA
jgi:hypothetical protein